MLSTLLVSRIQFAITISFHIIFPAFSIGLATYLVIVEGLWLKTRKKLYYQILRFWTKILALTFGMGIISGLAMQFQTGTNWSGFSEIVGPVLGVLFTLEALSAFFIEATFLGIMLFGWHIFSRKIHYFATIMVFLGVSLSAFWIMSANSWMQTPAGVLFQQDHFVVTSWLEVVFNHSTMLRYIHMLLAAYLSTACVILAVSAYYLLKKKFTRFARFNIKFATIAISLIIPLQIVMGDELGYRIHEYQPMKTASIEANWHNQQSAPLVLFAIIDQEKQKNYYEISVPYLASLLNTHQLHGELKGLDNVHRQDQPNVWLTFYSFRIMVGVGLILLFISWRSLWLLWRKKLWQQNLWHRVLVAIGPVGFIGLLTGWYTAETGRQPWVVYGFLKTSQGVSDISQTQVFLGFIIILLVYGIIFGIGYLGYFFKTVRHGPLISPRKRSNTKLKQLN